MVAFVLGFLMMLTVVIGVIGFAAWAIREHFHARKYRFLIRLHEELKRQAPINTVATGPRWEVTFRKGKKRDIEIFEADTEGDLMKLVMKGHPLETVEKWRKL